MKKGLLPILILAVLISCSQTSKKDKFISPPGYDLSQPKKLLMSDDLDEISGICFMPADSTIITHNDEEGKLYRLNMEGKIQSKPFKFAKKSDFEDLANDGTYWYMVKSDGEVTRVANAFTDSFSTKTYTYPEKGWEFETIFVDKPKHKIVILSKVPARLNEGRIPAFTLDTTTGAFNYDPLYSPDTLEIKNALQKKKHECKPTAAAFHPITGELYILSANEKMILTMKDGKVTGAYKLDKEMFRQPEGIAFMPDGTLMISNEAQESTANILIFNYQPK